MQSLLPFFTNKRILILVSGSVALYKILDLISILKKYNAHIKVVMSAQAQRFVSPLSFEALSGNLVLSIHTESWDIDKNINHISYAKWAQVVLIAPASANTIAKIAVGIADDIHLSTLLACNAPKLCAPAMNTAMLNAPQTIQNLQLLKQLGYVIIPPRETLLACGIYGNGALASNEEIVFALGKALNTIDETFSILFRFYQGKTVIISGGGSKEAIDDVRYMSNHSSGKQASELARVMYMLGANVIFISSSFPLTLPKDIKCVNAHSTNDYKLAINNAIIDSKTKKSPKKINSDLKPILFMAAALSDYKPTKSYKGKLKKDKIGKKWAIECSQNVDVLASISADSVYKIGFKAESNTKAAMLCAKAMLETKHCQMVCLNIVNAKFPFGSDENRIMVFMRNKDEIIHIAGSKCEVALGIAKAYATQQ